MSADLAGGLGAVALFAVPGYGLTELFPTLRRLAPVRRAAYGYLLGVAVVAGALYGLSHVLSLPLRPPAVWAAAAVPALAGVLAAVRRRRSRRQDSTARRVERLHDDAAPPAAAAAGEPPARETRPGFLAAWLRRCGGPLVVVAVAITSLVCVAVFAEALSDPVSDWDGRMTWCTQARYIRQAGTVDAEVLADRRWFVTHPQYPLLLPVAQVAVLEAFGADPDAPLMRALYAAFLPALLLVVYDGARRAAGRRTAALVVLAIAIAPFLLLGAGGAATTYSDVPLAAFYGAALVLLLGPRPRADSGLAAGLLLAAAALTKNEGALLAVVALALGWRGGRQQPEDPENSSGVSPAGVAGRLLPPRIWRLAAAAAPLVLALALLSSWRAGIVNRQDDSYPQLLQAGHLLSEVPSHVAVFAPILLNQMMSFDHWAGFWWMVPAVLLAGRRALRHPKHRRRLLAAAAPPALACAAYAVHPLTALVATVTWERFLLQGSVPGLIVLAGALAESWRPFRPWLDHRSFHPETLINERVGAFPSPPEGWEGD